MTSSGLAAKGGFSSQLGLVTLSRRIVLPLLAARVMLIRSLSQVLLALNVSVPLTASAVALLRLTVEPLIDLITVPSAMPVPDTASPAKRSVAPLTLV